jgi:hypothetical protein
VFGFNDSLPNEISISQSVGISIYQLFILPEADAHGAAANFTVVVHITRALRGGWCRHTKELKTTGAGDFD